MARSQSNNVVKWLGAGFAVIAGGAAFGYLFGSAHQARTTEQTAQPPVSATLTPAPKLNPSAIHPHMANGNYTAPGAPRITIEEQSQPILRRVTPPPAPAADPEASQEATAPAVRSTPETVPADTAPPTPTDTGSPAPTPAAAPSGAAGIAVPAPPSPPPAPADPDFEHVNGPKTVPKSGAPEAGQQGDKSQDGKSQTNTTGTETGIRAQFRVQTGAYTDESNARSVADTLRSEGFSASTRSERAGDRLVYKVQVGAYRSQIGASKAAGDLQRKGYPVFISPIGP